MSSIIRYGDTLHGISVFGRGVFTFTDKYGRGLTYAGQCKDGYACGLGVATYFDGDKEYAEYGPDGQCDGRCLVRSAFDGGTRYIMYGPDEQYDGLWRSRDYEATDYRLMHERGERKNWAVVFATATTTKRTARGTIRACLR
jgi:hypothetical protein